MYKICKLATLIKTADIIKKREKTQSAFLPPLSYTMVVLEDVHFYPSYVIVLVTAWCNNII